MTYPAIDLLDTKALKRRVERPHPTLLWGQKHIVTPRLLEKVFGDGKKLIGLGPIQTRPDYYVVRIDSRWSTSNWDKDSPMPPREWLDDVYQALEDQFGNGQDEDGEEREDAWFPEALLGVGTEWWEMDPRRFRANGSAGRRVPG